MIITFNGDHGSGKSTIAKRIASDLGYSFYYTGKIFREIAAEKGLTYAELMELMKKDETIDRKVDQKTQELGKTKDNFVFDSRMAWYFIPQSVKIFFKVDEDIAAERIYKNMTEEKSQDRKNEAVGVDSSLQVKMTNRKRKENDDKRYQKLYGVNIWDEQNYDLVVDTSTMDKEEVYEKVLSFIKEKIDE
jgi:cytidylate kinase